MKSIWSLPHQGRVTYTRTFKTPVLPDNSSLHESWSATARGHCVYSQPKLVQRYLPEYLNFWHWFWQDLVLLNYFVEIFLSTIVDGRRSFEEGLCKAQEYHVTSLNLNLILSNFFLLTSILLSSVVTLDCRSYQEVFLRKMTSVGAFRKMTFVVPFNLKQMESPKLWDIERSVGNAQT